jgi:hypothetical protein
MAIQPASSYAHKIEEAPACASTFPGRKFMAWNVQGTYIEACNCEVACPCIFFSPPTEGECKVVVGWHVDKGQHGDTVLDGLNAALIAYAPGNMKDGQWKVALYLDERGDDRQRAALQGIFSGADGGHIANLGPLIGQVLGARPAKITFDRLPLVAPEDQRSRDRL